MDAPPTRTPRFREYGLIILIFLVSLTHGLLYVFIVPPWQHADEPTYFEYVWLIANRQSLPTIGDYDQAMRRAVALSMLEHGFFHDLSFRPDLDSPDDPIWIGQPQLGDPPLYFILATPPLWLLARTRFYADATVQLYATRLMSLMLYLLTIGLSYCVVGELTPPGHVLGWSVPLSIALLPGFTDLMTAVNNDVGAVFVFSLFLWAVVRMILHGVSLLRFLGVLGSAALCLWTKNTVLVAVPLVPAALGLSLFYRKWKPIFWVMPWIGGPVVAAMMFGWGDAALWYRETAQTRPTRTALVEAPLGRYVIGLEVTPATRATVVRQALLVEDVKALRGQGITLGAWMWATAPTRVHLPMVFDGHQATPQAVEVGTAPAFYAMRVNIATEADRPQVILQADLDPEQAEAVTAFYDGIVLVEGEWPLGEPPVFDDADGNQGMWGGRPFHNRVRNASAERGWPRVRPWIESLVRRSAQAYVSPSTVLASVLDWEYTNPLYLATGVFLHQTFWGRFGWTHVPLPGTWYRGLWVITALGVVGSILTLWRTYGRHSTSWQVAIIGLGLAALLIWGIAFLRGFLTVLDDRIQLPPARYAFPAVIPTVLLLCAGWRELLHRSRGLQIMIHFTAFLALDGASLLTIINFYKGR